VQPRDGETVETKSIRFRTMGDAPITGAIESSAQDLNGVIRELLSASQTERGNRADDQLSENAMEDRKKQGYF
jgi:sulfate adenylyltransferase subunit 2